MGEKSCAEVTVLVKELAAFYVVRKPKEVESISLE
tara:strand:+ start:742 stop:846 length:105 start_codon:yes stop_codon:yes gene_type:complete